MAYCVTCRGITCECAQSLCCSYSVLAQSVCSLCAVRAVCLHSVCSLCAVCVQSVHFVIQCTTAVSTPTREKPQTTNSYSVTTQDRPTVSTDVYRIQNYSKTPIIRIANYRDRLGPSGKSVENSTKLTCLEITSHRIKCSTVLCLIELQIRRGRNV